MRIRTGLIGVLLLCMGELAAQTVRSDTLVKELLQEWDIPITEGNSVRLLKSGKAKFADLFDAVRQAKHHIHLEYFNFRNDSIAGALFELLAQKAAEGVEVRALFDAFGNMSNNRPLKKKHLREIRALGIDIHQFDPIRFPYFNHILKRDHRKIVVIDGKRAYTGGMNVADYYLNGTPQVGSWRDMHLCLEGPAVDDLQRIFLKIWNQTTRQHLREADYLRGSEGRTETAVALPATDEEAGRDTTWLGTSLLQAVQTELDSCHSGRGLRHEGVELAVVDREPGVTPKEIRRAYAASINGAERKIQLINPYFVPTHSIKKALKRAIRRNVEVEIMISSHSDIPFTPDATYHFAHRLAKRGATVYLYEKGFHHSKIMMVDDRFCTLGSANLNSRSLRYDYEVNLFLFDEGVTAELSEMFEADKQDSTVLTEEVWKGRSRWKRFVGWFANLFAPFL